jgi:hypothetical protein
VCSWSRARGCLCLFLPVLDEPRRNRLSGCCKRLSPSRLEDRCEWLVESSLFLDSSCIHGSLSPYGSHRVPTCPSRNFLMFRLCRLGILSLLGNPPNLGLSGDGPSLVRLARLLSARRRPVCLRIVLFALSPAHSAAYSRRVGIGDRILACSTAIAPEHHRAASLEACCTFGTLVRPSLSS